MCDGFLWDTDRARGINLFIVCNSAINLSHNRIKSVKTGHIYWAALCSVAYFYMVSSWGGYVFLINLIPMHVFVLMVSGRFSHR